MVKIFKWLFVITAILAAQSAWKHLTKAGGRTIYDTPDREAAQVYVSETGSKFHRRDCRFANGHMISLGLEEALRTYQPCSVCKPSSS